MSQPMSWYSGQAGAAAAGQRPEIVTADLGDVLKRQEKPQWRSRFVTPKSIFMGVGTVLLGMLSIVPIWNAIILLQDSNYVFWVGRRVPEGVVVACVIIVFLYVAIVALFFRKSQALAHTEHSMMMIANIFITLFGLFLMLVSQPLTHQSELTYNNLLHRCEFSDQTHRLFEYSQVLQNIRASPECAKKYTIEECAGYEEAAPYTSFLKGMENNFRCAGFCYRPPALAAAAAPGPAPAAAASPAPAPAASASLLSTKQRVRGSHSNHMTLIAEGAVTSSLEASKMQPTATYPPTLFSNANFQASCEGMAARNMKHFAGDMGQQTFYQGTYLVFVAVMSGMLKLVGMCARKA